MCQSLQLDRVATEYAGIAQHAAHEELSFSDFLERLLKNELDGRYERTRSTLLKLATLPAIRTLEDYDFEFAAGTPKTHAPSWNSQSNTSHPRT